MALMTTSNFSELTTWDSRLLTLFDELGEPTDKEIADEIEYYGSVLMMKTPSLGNRLSELLFIYNCRKDAFTIRAKGAKLVSTVDDRIAKLIEQKDLIEEKADFYANLYIK